MTTASFQARQRLKEVRAAIRLNPELDRRKEEYFQLINFFEDLRDNLAGYGQGDAEANSRFIMSAMIAASHREFAERLVKAVNGKTTELAYPNTKLKEGQSGDERSWKFPVIEHPSGTSGAGFDANFREFSALKMFGYTVGKTDGWPRHKRRALLADFMEMKLPKIVEQTFGEDYGQPMTAERLRKVANLIANNARNALRRNASSMKYAIEDWEDDLDFLKQKYYLEANLRFHPWPNSKNR